MKVNALRHEYRVDAYTVDVPVTVMKIDGQTFYHIQSEDVEGGTPLLCTPLKSYTTIPKKAWNAKIKYKGLHWILHLGNSTRRLYQEEVESLYDE